MAINRAAHGGLGRHVRSSRLSRRRSSAPALRPLRQALTTSLLVRPLAASKGAASAKSRNRSARSPKALATPLQRQMDPIGAQIRFDPEEDWDDIHMVRRPEAVTDDLERLWRRTPRAEALCASTRMRTGVQSRRSP